MTRDIDQVVREACLWLPEATETLAHGFATFKVRGKTFAYFTVNHHGDQRIALILNSPPGAQQSLVSADSKRFFVPPYVGPRGWLGVQLDKGLPWSRVVGLVCEAYAKVAPRALGATMPPRPTIHPPTERKTAAQIDPLKGRQAQSLLKRLRRICLGLPETSEQLQFGRPVWKAGKKTFAMLQVAASRLNLCIWVGVERQELMTADPRFTIPPYVGHNGWLALETDARCDLGELRQLLEDSYRHFALRRMLTALDAP